MRILLIPMLLISFLNPTTAQTKNPSRDATDIIVIKKSWHKTSYRPGWDRFIGPTFDRRRPAPVREGFTYEVTIKNTGGKTVRAVGWDYVFTDPEDKQANHHRFFHRTKIGPGEKTSLSKFVIQPPTRTVRASTADKIVEEVVINYIEYQDGSIWRRQ